MAGKPRNRKPQLDKRCGVCGVTKPVTEFYSHSQKPNLYHSECKPCNKARAIAWRKKNPLTKEQMKAHSLKQNYGLSWAEYQSMMNEQNGACAICLNAFDMSDDHGRTGKNKPCVDHCHSTGKVRGILCGQCNRGLGFFAESPGYLQNAINYLQEV